MEILRSPADEWTARRLGVSVDELSQELLEKYQLRAFRRALEYAEKSSYYYREKLAGIETDSICSMEDIRKIPFTSEADLCGNEWSFQCVSCAQVCRTVTVPTTGTSGKRKHIAFSEDDMRSAMDFIRTGFMTMCRENDRMLVMMSGGTPGSIGDSVDKALKPLGITTKVIGSVTDIAGAYASVMDFRPDVIVAVPYHAAALARYGQRFGNPEKAFIRSVLLSADDVPGSVCERLRRLWECNTYRHYGMTEMCIAGGVECTGANGYHLRACDILFEIPEPDEDGFGEIVITTLDREAMPLIRYRTGDIGRFVEETCPCGSRLKRLDTVRGRINERISVSGKELYLSDISNAVFSDDAAVDFGCEYDGTELYISVGVLPGDRADAAFILQKLGAPAKIRCYETEAFENGYNLKKKIIRHE